MRRVITTVVLILLGCDAPQPTPGDARQVADAGQVSTIPAGEIRAQLTAAGTVQAGQVRVIGASLAALADADSAVRLQGLAAGSYDLAFGGTVGATTVGQVKRGVVLGATEGVDLGVIALAGVTKIHGTVKRDGTAIEGATVVVQGAATARTDAAGAYSLEAAAGTHDVIAVWMDGGKTRSQAKPRVTVAGDTLVDFAVTSTDPETATIRGKVISRDDSAITLQVVPAGQTEGPVTQAAVDGTFAVEVPAGLYVVVARQALRGVTFGPVAAFPDATIPTLRLPSEGDCDGDGTAIPDDLDDDADGAADATEAAACRCEPSGTLDADANGICDAVEPPRPPVPDAPVPGLESVSPATVFAGSAAVELTLIGTGFVASSGAQLDEVPIATTFVSATELRATASAAQLVAAGARSLRVVTPAPGGGTSAVVTISVNNPVPELDATTPISPSTAPQGAAALTITLKGSGFNTSTVARWNGADRVTTLQDATTIKASIPSEDLTAAGTASVTIFNPAPGGGTTSPVPFQISAPAPRAYVLEQLNLAADGTRSNGEVDQVTLSRNGRQVTFKSGADNLVPGDTNQAVDVFVRDTCRGGGDACTPSVTRVSVKSDGSEAAGSGPLSSWGTTSANGRYVAFESTATNLEPAWNGMVNTYVRDTCIGAPGGCTPSTIMVSARPDGTAGNGYGPLAISGDGRFVTFKGQYALVSGNVADIDAVHLIRDTCLGATSCVPATTLAMPDSGGAPPNLGVRHPVMSGTGRYLAVCSTASNLGGDGDDGYARDVFLRDTCFGATGCTPANIWVSVDTGDTNGSCSDYGFLSLSADARYVAYVAIQAGVYTSPHVFVRDTCIGVSAGCTPSTTLATVSTAGVVGEYGGIAPSLSANGRFLAFTSWSRNLVPDDTNGKTDIFVRDLCLGATGCTPSTVRVSIHADGTQANDDASDPSLSADGSLVSFRSRASNLVSGDTPFTSDAFLSKTGFGP